MRRKVIITIFLGILLTFLNPAPVESYNNEYNLLQNVFLLSQAHFDQIKIISWAKFNNDKEAKDSAIFLEKTLSKEKMSNRYFHYKISFSQNDHYIASEIQIKKLNVNLTELKNKIKNCYFAQKEKAYFSTIYSGYYMGQLSKDQMAAVSAKILSALQAKNTDIFADENYYFANGNTPYLKKNLIVENKIVNINIAFRYNKLENKTLFYIGTPIISIEY